MGRYWGEFFLEQPRMPDLPWPGRGKSYRLLSMENHLLASYHNHAPKPQDPFISLSSTCSLMMTKPWGGPQSGCSPTVSLQPGSKGKKMQLQYQDGAFSWNEDVFLTCKITSQNYEIKYLWYNEQLPFKWEAIRDILGRAICWPVQCLWSPFRMTRCLSLCCFVQHFYPLSHIPRIEIMSYILIFELVSFYSI